METTISMDGTSSVTNENDNCIGSALSLNDVSEEECVENELVFMDKLKVWAIQNQIKHTALNDLLNILKRNGHISLPLDSRTLLSTPRQIVLEEMGSGSFWYGGITKCLIRSFSYFEIPNEIRLNFNMDGLPVYNSSKTEFWPILMNIANNTTTPTMVVAIYCGVGKPNSEMFLNAFCEELLELTKSGLILNNTRLKIAINAFICDTPARALFKCKYYT